VFGQSGGEATIKPAARVVAVDDIGLELADKLDELKERNHVPRIEWVALDRDVVQTIRMGRDIVLEACELAGDMSLVARRLCAVEVREHDADDVVQCRDVE
jgi:hypothetical protein